MDLLGWRRLIGGLRKHPPSAYGFAVTSAVVALGLRLWLDPVLPPGFPYLTFFPAVIVTAFLAGAGPGTVCAVLSGLAAWYFFIPPMRSFGLDGQSAIALLFYAGIVGVDIALIHLMQRSAGRLAEAQEVTAGLLQQQRLMFQELQHRVANNMAFVSSLLSLQRRKVMAAPETAVRALDEASARLNTMAQIHRRLYDPASVELPVGQYLQDICTDLLKATDARNIVVLVDMPAVKLDISRLMILSLLVAEVVTNSLKHAFEGREGGTISLQLDQLDAERMVLTIRDDGKGMPERARPARALHGLGTSIIQGLAKQLGGELSVVGGQGTTTRLVFRVA